MALGKKDRDSTPTPTSFEVKLNDPKRKRDERAKAQANNTKPFRKRTDEYTYAFGTKWRTKRPGQIDLDSKTGQLYWGEDVT